MLDTAQGEAETVGAANVLVTAEGDSETAGAASVFGTAEGEAEVGIVSAARKASVAGRDGN